VLDANALLLPFRSSISLVAEVRRLLPGSELAVPSSVLEELHRLARSGVPFAGAAAQLARSLRAVPVTRPGDAGVAEAAHALGAWVLTADRKLAEELRSSGVPVLRPRDRARLEIARERRRPRPRARRSGALARRPKKNRGNR
jgi:rRNA-processing protein FCF1